MIAVITVLLAVPLGFFVKSRLAANTIYAVAYLWAFTYQTLYLLLDSLGNGSNPAFTTDEFPLSYGAVTLGIFAVGFGLVGVGQWAGARRRAKRMVLATS